MNLLITGLLANALLALPLAGIAAGANRYLRRPALSHALWVLVLMKLVTPPMVSLAVVVDASRWPAVARLLPVADRLTQPNPDDSSVAGWTGMSIHTARSVASLTSLANSPLDDLPLTAMTAPPATRGAANPQLADLRAGLAWASSPDRVTRLLIGWLVALLAVVWACGAVAMAGIVAYRLRLVCRLLRLSGQHDRRATASAAAIYAHGLRRPPAVILVDAILPPALLGIGPWTRILFPRQLWQTLSIAERESLLAHEVEHYRRGDHWVRLLEAVVAILFWWHPLVWWARRQIEVNEEACCDAAAAESTAARPRLYAQALLAALDFLSDPACRRSIPLASGIRSRPPLEQRLYQIMTGSVQRRLGRGGRVAVALLAAIVLPLQPWLLGSVG